MPFEWITTRSPPLETRRHLHHYSCVSNRFHHPHCSNPPSRVQTPHRTTARRGHTPAAHGRSSSSPSPLSPACSLQHKITTRQRKKQKETSHTTATPQSQTTASQTKHSSHFIAASGLSLLSSIRAVRGTHSSKAGTACGQQKQDKRRSTSHMTVCSNRPLDKGTARILIIPGRQQNQQ
ncbi:hypothetical protein TCDM_13222 [Trypanosoma cruzi Dm28c]|uniref:Uncharacterized protein n=1 Tax=Trypanosoma cruzi Dm28c TaxID=1416333 RepID=V5A3F1_TRYCR|nr:hypothetical protein TCDM_13222 [Trypanosoma cruzi Dm28c]